MRDDVVELSEGGEAKEDVHDVRGQVNARLPFLSKNPVDKNYELWYFCIEIVGRYDLYDLNNGIIRQWLWHSWQSVVSPPLLGENDLVYSS